MSKKNLRKAQGHVKEQKEFEEEVLQIDRVTRVVKGGRRLRFRCTVAIGDKKGRVGIGIGKATEVVTGIKKAVSRAKKNLIKVPITSSDSIPHEVKIKHKAARLIILPASTGTGVIAGGTLRKILNLAGIKNILSKNIGTRNKVVTAQASIMALQKIQPLTSKEEEKVKVIMAERAVEDQEKRKQMEEQKKKAKQQRYSDEGKSKKFHKKKEEPKKEETPKAKPEEVKEEKKNEEAVETQVVEPVVEKVEGVQESTPEKKAEEVKEEAPKAEEEPKKEEGGEKKES